MRAVVWKVVFGLMALPLLLFWLWLASAPDRLTRQWRTATAGRMRFRWCWTGRESRSAWA